MGLIYDFFHPSKEKGSAWTMPKPAKPAPSLSKSPSPALMPPVMTNSQYNRISSLEAERSRRTREEKIRAFMMLEPATRDNIIKIVSDKSVDKAIDFLTNIQADYTQEHIDLDRVYYSVHGHSGLESRYSPDYKRIREKVYGDNYDGLPSLKDLIDAHSSKAIEEILIDGGENGEEE